MQGSLCGFEAVGACKKGLVNVVGFEVVGFGV